MKRSHIKRRPKKLEQEITKAQSPKNEFIEKMLNM